MADRLSWRRRDRKAIARAAEEPARAQSVIEMGVVLAVDAEAGTATIEVDDVTSLVYPPGGVGLPGVGDMVPMARNGADWIPLAWRHLVSGTLESGDGFDIFAEKGWGLTAEGDSFFRNVYAQGLIDASVIQGSEIIGSIFKTSTGEPRLEIKADGTIEWHTGLGTESGPGAVIFANGLVSISSPASSGEAQQAFVNLHNTGLTNSIVARARGINLNANGSGGMVIESSGDIDLAATGEVNLTGAVKINDRPARGLTSGTFTGATNASGDITISHGLGVTASMTVTPTSGSNSLAILGGLRLVRQSRSSTSNTFRCYVGGSALGASVDIVVDWVAAPA